MLTINRKKCWKFKILKYTRQRKRTAIRRAAAVEGERRMRSRSLRNSRKQKRAHRYHINNNKQCVSVCLSVWWPIYTPFFFSLNCTRKQTSTRLLVDRLANGSIINKSRHRKRRTHKNIETYCTNGVELAFTISQRIRKRRQTGNNNNHSESFSK